MKRFLCIVLTLVLIGTVAVASEVDTMTQEELYEIITQLQEENARLQDEVERLLKALEPAATPEPTPVPQYIELTKGSKGEEAKRLQQRLIDLGYLSGSADGIYGNGTAGAVSSFQAQNGLSATGTADVTTQELLFSDAAEKAIVYEKLDYKGVSRNPDEYEGRYVKFNGEVLQAIEGEYTISFLIYVNSDYKQLVKVNMDRPEKYSRILEDDLVTVMGEYAGLYSYETVRGDENTVPQINALTVTLR